MILRFSAILKLPHLWTSNTKPPIHQRSIYLTTKFLNFLVVFVIFCSPLLWPWRICAPCLKSPAWRPQMIMMIKSNWNIAPSTNVCRYWPASPCSWRTRDTRAGSMLNYTLSTLDRRTLITLHIHIRSAIRTELVHRCLFTYSCDISDSGVNAYAVRAEKFAHDPSALSKCRMPILLTDCSSCACM